MNPWEITDENYVCSLDENSLTKAKKELNEDPKDRLGAVKALREWIQAQPHFTARTGKQVRAQCST